MVSLLCCKNNDTEQDARYLPSGGIETKRGCTDILFLIIFVLFWIGMVVVAGFALAMGNPLRLAYPTDYEGNMCGRMGNRNLTDRPYLYFPIDFTTVLNPVRLYDAKDTGICVSQCPNTTIPVPRYDDIDITTLDVDMAVDGVICNYDFDNLTGTFQGLIQWSSTEGGCFLSMFPTTSVTRRCLPDLPAIRDTGILELNTATAAAVNTTVFAGEMLTEGAWEIYNAWAVILISVALCIFLCFVYVFAMRIFVAPVTYITIIMVQLVLAGGGAYFTYSGHWWIQEAETPTETKVGRTILGFGIALCCLAGIYFLLLLWLLRRIRFAIQIIKEASKTLLKMPSLLCFPVVTFSLVAALSVYAVIIAAFLGSATRDVTLSSEQLSGSLTGYFNQSITVSRYDNTLRWFELYHVFGYFWGNAFIVALEYTTTAGAVAAYFFSSPGKKKVPRLAVLRSLGRTVRYHLGSLALGSLLVAVIQFLRYLIKKVSKRINKTRNRTIKAVEKVANFVLWILEKIIKYINKNAYIVMSIQGKGFCASAKRGFLLLLENILRVSAVNMMGSFILFLGKLLITILVAIVAYMLLDTRFQAGDFLAPHVRYAVLPTLLVAVISFIICTIFMDVYDTVIDTMLLCVCFDESNNDGNAKPYYMPKSIQKVVKVKNEQVQELQDSQEMEEKY